LLRGGFVYERRERFVSQDVAQNEPPRFLRYLEDGAAVHYESCVHPACLMSTASTRLPEVSQVPQARQTNRWNFPVAVYR